MEQGQPIRENPEQVKLKDLGVGVWKLSNDGNESYLLEFISKYGVQDQPLNLDARNEMKLYAFISFNIGRIEKDLAYDQAINFWKILKDSGALSAEKLGKYINRYIQSNMNFNKEESDSIKKNLGSNVPSYSPEFLNEFKLDLKEKIKEALGWDVNID